jgi:hypothetical protein
MEFIFVSQTSRLSAIAARTSVCRTRNGIHPGTTAHKTLSCAANALIKCDSGVCVAIRCPKAGLVPARRLLRPPHHTSRFTTGETWNCPIGKSIGISPTHRPCCLPPLQILFFSCKKMILLGCLISQHIFQWLEGRFFGRKCSGGPNGENLGRRRSEGLGCCISRVQSENVDPRRYF